MAFAFSSGAAVHIFLLKPTLPPWRWQGMPPGSLFVARVYSLPSSVKTPLAMRLPKRPTVAPN